MKAGNVLANSESTPILAGSAPLYLPYKEFVLFID